MVGRLFTKSCLFAIAVWIALVGVYGYVAWDRVRDPVGAAAIGILGGTFSALLLSSIVGLFTGDRDRGALRRAAAMDAPRDGRLEAASGPIRAIETPLEAPFTGQPCVVYEYDVKRGGQGQSDFAGFAMAPCAIDTPRGPARVLGFVMLDQFPAATDDRIDRGRGERYLSSVPFESLGVTSILSVLGEMIADDDGTVRKDYRIAADGVNLDGRRITERSLPAGTAVTIIGRWSEARAGFAPTGPGSINRLFPGDLERTRRQVGGASSVKTVGLALVLFLVLHAFLVPMYFLAPAGGKARAAAGSVWDERDCDRQQSSLAQGANPNEVGSDAVTPLMNAARLGEPACVSQLIAAGARLEATDKFSDTALVHAVRAGRDDNAQILLDAGAKEFRVTAATGRPIADGDAPLAAVHDYIDALYRGDFETMARLRAHTSVRRMADMRDDLPMWQSLRPKTFTVERGWMTERAATLTILGRTSTGEHRVAYHVERQPDRSRAEAETPGPWQITQEWFIER